MKFNFSKIIIFSLIIFLSIEKLSLPQKNLNKYPIPIEFSDIRSDGDLEVRLQKNFERLGEKIYEPDTAFASSPTWPGDYIGRLILGLTLLSQSTHHESKNLEKIIRMLPSKMNSLGYFGKELPNGIADEQQLSGNGWVLRGLCEYYIWKKNPKVLVMIKRIIKNLALPTIKLQLDYPINPLEREHGGSYIGQSENKIINGWILSTDIGCNYIFLDGLTQAYEILKEPKLKELINEMINVFLKIDLKSIEAQTHATLTTLRALCRFYELTDNPKLLEAVIERFNLYKNYAMSANYENYNWFGRPVHSEPCAIIDSYIVAEYLWRFTNDPAYLEDAQHIYYNAISATQRDNGGFGCNTCTTAQNPNLNMSLYEAYWCCTMRGGEGLSRILQYSYMLKDINIYLTNYFNNEATFHFNNCEMKIKQSTSYPFFGSSQLTILKSNLNSKIRLWIFAPSFADHYIITLNNHEINFKKENGFLVLMRKFKKGDRINIDFKLKTELKNPVGNDMIKGYKTIQYGPLILSAPESKNNDIILPINAQLNILSNHTFKYGNFILVPLYNLMNKFSGKQVLFKVSKN